MSEMLSDARCIATQNGYRITVTPPKPFTKVSLHFLDGSDGAAEVVLESPAPDKGRCNWLERDAEGRPIEQIQPPDEIGMRKLKIYAALDPVTECSFLVRHSESEEGLKYLSYVSITVTESDGFQRRLGFLRIK